MWSARDAEDAGDRQEAARATVTPVPSARTANRRHAPGRESAPRRPTGQSRARSGRWERGVLHGQVLDHPTPQVAGMDVDEVPATGSRPDRLAGVRFSSTQWTRSSTPRLPILDVPVPLIGEQLVDVLRFFNTLCPVPKISLEDIPARRLCRVPQLVEQLVEVPTVVSYSSFLQRTVEQTVDNPASRGRGLRGGIEGFFPGQGSTAAVVDIPVPRGDLQGFLPGQGSIASSSSLIAANEAGQGVFRTFPHGNKCGVPGRSVRTCPGTSAHGPRRLMQPSGFHEEQLAMEKEEDEGDVSASGADALPPRHLGTVYRVHVAGGVIKGDDGRMYTFRSSCMKLVVGYRVSFFVRGLAAYGLTRVF